jgi:protein gp37
MNNTEIVWTEKTWNPTSGCHPVSEECRHCYARSLAEQRRGTVAFPVGFDIVMKPHKLDEPRKIKAPALIFVNSMSDLFLDEITDEYRDRILTVIRETPRHTFQTLTKRPENAARYFSTRDVPANLWLGVTCGGASWAHRIDVLRTINAMVRFVSVEPLIEPLGQVDLSGIHWVIVGGESGNHLSDPAVALKRALVSRVRGKWTAREDRVQWIRDIRDQCTAAGVAFLFKQWGGTRGHLAGRTLDGRIWDEYPARG